MLKESNLILREKEKEKKKEKEEKYLPLSPKEEIEEGIKDLEEITRGNKEEVINLDEARKITRETIGMAEEIEKDAERIEEAAEIKLEKALEDILLQNKKERKNWLKIAMKTADKFLKRTRIKFEKLVPPNRLKEIERSLARKVKTLLILAIALESIPAGASEGEKKQTEKADNLALATTAEVLSHSDKDTTTLATQEALEKGVITQKELEKYKTPSAKEEGKVELNFKYPEDAEGIKKFIKKLASTDYQNDTLGLSFDLEFLTEKVNYYNQKHPDDKINLAQATESLPEETKDLIKEYLSKEFHDVLNETIEDFRSDFKSRRLPRGKKNIISLFWAMRAQAKQGKWDKIIQLWEKRVDYYPPVYREQRYWDEYNHKLEQLEYEISLIKTFLVSG